MFVTPCAFDVVSMIVCVGKCYRCFCCSASIVSCTARQCWQLGFLVYSHLGDKAARRGRELRFAGVFTPCEQAARQGWELSLALLLYSHLVDRLQGRARSLFWLCWCIHTLGPRLQSRAGDLGFADLFTQPYCQHILLNLRAHD